MDDSSPISWLPTQSNIHQQPTLPWTIPPLPRPAMYYSQQPSAHSRNNPQVSDHVPGQPKQLPPLNSMSVPALLQDQSVQSIPDYRSNPAIASSYPSSSSHSHVLYQPSHNHHQLSHDVESHSHWSRLPYAFESTVDPSPERGHMQRFSPSHQHPHGAYHHASETRTAVSSFVPIGSPFSAAAPLEHNLISPNANYIPRQRSTIESPSPSYPSQVPQSCTPSGHAQTQVHRQTSVEDEPLATSRPKKSRRAKPHIELAPDQPLTTQGKPRARVYVACVQWSVLLVSNYLVALIFFGCAYACYYSRTRKIRCDGAKPACHNCVRRAKADDECSYDVAPKRRGPDKVPGARQRIAREARMEGSVDSGMSTGRRRRRRDGGDANENSTAVSEDASGRDEDPGGAAHSTSPALTLPPLRPPSLVLDVQLSNIAPFPGSTGSSMGVPTSAEAQIHYQASASTLASVLGPGFGSVIPSSAQDYAEDILYTTNTQVLA